MAFHPLRTQVGRHVKSEKCQNRTSTCHVGRNIANGDVIEKHDVFGDGVNIAARLEQVAPLGGLCLSEDAYRQVPVMLPPGCDRPATRSVAPQDHPRAHDNGDRRPRLLCGAWTWRW